MNVNQKGNIGLLKVITDLYNKGYYCFTPFDDYSPIDCIALDVNGKTFRIQVKYRSADKFGRYELAARSVVNGKSIPINRLLIDYWAIYLAEFDKVIYFPSEKMEGKGCHYFRETDFDTYKDFG